MRDPARPVMRYHGGKFLLAPWIVGHFPAHKIYVETHGGAASVLMYKPRARSEYYNETNKEVTNLFRVLRDPAQSARLAELCWLTPFSRLEHEASYELSGDPIEDARRLVVRSFLSFSSSGHGGLPTGFRGQANTYRSLGSHDWANYPPAIEQFCRRLAGVTIEHRDALDVIRDLDTPDTLFYCDPPYVHSTRGRRHRKEYGEGEMGEADHRALAAVLNNVSGMVALSGYDSELYAELFPSTAWRMVSTRTFADAKGAPKSRIECLWLNRHLIRKGLQPGFFE